MYCVSCQAPGQSQAGPSPAQLCQHHIIAVMIILMAQAMPALHSAHMIPSPPGHLFAVLRQLSSSWAVTGGPKPCPGSLARYRCHACCRLALSQPCGRAAAAAAGCPASEEGTSQPANSQACKTDNEQDCAVLEVIWRCSGIDPYIGSERGVVSPSP